MRFKETYLGAEGSNTRNRRHGSFGRSVVSTHVYSSGRLHAIKCIQVSIL